VFLTLLNFHGSNGFELPFFPSPDEDGYFEARRDLFTTFTWIAFGGAMVLVFVKNTFYKVAGLVLIALSYALSKNWAVFLTVFLPTLVHVYIFTGLFMLYGALKSKSRTGLLAVGVLVLCPVLLAVLWPGQLFIPVTEYGQKAYIGGGNGFVGLNQVTLHHFFGFAEPGTPQAPNYWIDAVFKSKAGVILIRFIAFAYTYHYLNWFSKTSIIQWHKVPKVRFALVLLFWAASVAIYVYDYALGLQWLFFLSFLHVLLEFPLNYVSVAGIGAYFRDRFFGPKNPTKTPQRVPTAR
jgi:hypothetical protein